MKTQYKRDIHQEYFKSLKSFQYNPYHHPSVANHRQLVLANNLHRSYDIDEGKMLRLIMYADIALNLATESEIEMYYSDFKEIFDFEIDPVPIEKIVFRGSEKPLGYSKSFEISNPFLIDKLYNSLMEFIDFQKVIKEKKATEKKKHSLAPIIKKVATELYIELTEKENISDWKSLCIIGFIFSLYKVGLKNEEPILTESEYKVQNEIKKAQKIPTESYLQYLSNRIKKYIKRRVVKIA